MTPQILDWIRLVRVKFPFKAGRVLEIGSMDVNGTPRGSFPDAREYIGLDFQPGPGVDLVLNSHKAVDKFGRRSFDTILCCEMLEHDIAFLDTIWAIRKMITFQGIVIITTPTFGFPLHRFPKDYWRFGEDAYREVFFRGFEILDLRHLDEACGPGTTLAGIGRLP